MNSDKGHILVVDDETQLLELLRLEFEDHDFRVYTAESVDEAIASINREKPFLILSDLKMPGKSGKELFHYVKENHSDIHFLFMSGHSEGGDAEIGDADHFFEKPFSLKSVVDEVVKLFEKSA